MEPFFTGSILNHFPMLMHAGCWQRQWTGIDKLALALATLISLLAENRLIFLLVKHVSSHTELASPLARVIEMQWQTVHLQSLPPFCTRTETSSNVMTFSDEQRMAATCSVWCGISLCMILSYIGSQQLILQSSGHFKPWESALLNTPFSTSTESFSALKASWSPPVPGLACLKRHWAALMCISKTID